MELDSIIEEDPAKEYARKMNIIDAQISELELDIKEAIEMKGEADYIQEKIYELQAEVSELEKKKKYLKDSGISKK